MRRILQGEFDFHIIFTHVQKQTGYMCVTCHMCTLNIYVCSITYMYVCIKEYLLINKDLKPLEVQPVCGVCGVCLVCVVCSRTCCLVLGLTLNSGMSQGLGKCLPGGQRKPMRVLIKIEV